MEAAQLTARELTADLRAMYDLVEILDADISRLNNEREEYCSTIRGFIDLSSDYPFLQAKFIDLLERVKAL
jgi:prefoldin subunit 5